MVATAIIGSAVVGAVATSSAASKASKAQTNAANKANETMSQQYQQTRQDLMPYQQAGQAALPYYNALLGTGGDSTSALKTLQQTPGYQFTLSQGLKAAANSAAARGLGVSGAAFKGAENYGAQLANQTYGDQVNRLMGAAQLGENAAAQTGAYGTQTAANIGNNITGAGNAQAAASVAQGNALSGLASSIPNAMIYNKLFSGTGGMTGMYQTPSYGGMAA